jgi:transposase
MASTTVARIDGGYTTLVHADALVDAVIWKFRVGVPWRDLPTLRLLVQPE